MATLKTIHTPNHIGLPRKSGPWSGTGEWERHENPARVKRAAPRRIPSSPPRDPISLDRQEDRMVEPAPSEP